MVEAPAPTSRTILLTTAERMIYSAHNYWLVLVSVVAGAVGFLIFGIRHLSGSTTADTALISTPALVVMAAACATWATLSVVFPTDVACLLVFGLYAGYNHYALLHHLQHRRGTVLACLAGLERVHRIHHGSTLAVLSGRTDARPTHMPIARRHRRRAARHGLNWAAHDTVSRGRARRAAADAVTS